MKNQATSGDPRNALASAGYFISDKLLESNLTLLDAAVALSEGGFNVVPTTSTPTRNSPSVDAAKNPGGLLGKGWQGKSSSDPDVLAAWFSEPSGGARTVGELALRAGMYREVPFESMGLAVHAGPDVVIVDIDDPSLVPEAMWPELEEAPFQSSSAVDERRGHYYFRVRVGYYFGHTSAIVGVDGCASPGEIRHGNAIAVSAPTIHPKGHLGRRYEWQRAGVVPVMSEALAKWLQSRRTTADFNGVELSVAEASLDSIRAFRDNCTESRSPEVLDEHLDFMRQQADVMGLHLAWLPPLIDLMQMATFGLVSAAEAMDAAGDAFVALRTDPSRAQLGGNVSDEESATREYLDLLKWAVGRVQAKLAADPEALQYETFQHVGTYHGVEVPLLPVPAEREWAASTEENTDGTNPVVAAQAAARGRHVTHLTAVRGGGDGCTAAQADEWEPLDPFRAPPPALPIDGLPNILRQFVIEAAEELQVPTDLVLNHALGALSSAPYGTIQLEIRTGWTVPLNLAVMTLAKSGELKSPLNAVVMKPFDQIEADRRDRDCNAELDRAAKIAALSAKLDEVKRTLTSTRKSAAPTATLPAAAPSPPAGSGYISSILAPGSPYTEVATLEREIIRLKSKPLRWSSVMDDATPEAVGVRLGSTFTGAAMMRSDETNIFSHIAGQSRNGGGTDKAKVYLHGVSGDRIQTDRLGRDEVCVERPSLSLALMMQPTVFESTIQCSPQLVDIGIVPRLLIVRPESKVGSRKADPTPMSRSTVDGWSSAIRAIAAAADAHVERILADRATEAEATGKTVPSRQVEPRPMRVTAAGWELLRAYKDRIESELGKDGRLEPVASWGSKSTTYIAQIAALLTLLDDPGASEVDTAYIVVGEKLMDGYALHHLALAEVPTEAAAEAIWSRIADLDDREFGAEGFITLRAVRKLIQNQAWFKNADARYRDERLREALQTLEARGYIKIAPGVRRDSLKIKRRSDDT